MTISDTYSPIPVALGYGLIALYNVDNRSSLHNINAPDGFNWANVYQLSWYGIPNYIGVGNSVLFKGADLICTLAFSRKQYPIIEAARLVTITELNQI